MRRSIHETPEERAAWREGDRAFLVNHYGFLVGLTLASLGLSADPEVEDLEQEARIALVLAMEAYDPEQGPFTSYVIPRVRGRVLEWRRSRCSWVRRTGQKALAHVEAATLALELRGEEATEAAVRALLEDARDYDRAAALPTLVSLTSDDDPEEYAAGIEGLAEDGPELVAVVWSLENAALIERAIRRLTAIDRAVFRGTVQRGMRVSEVAQVLDIKPAEVTRRRNKTLATLRQFLKRVTERLAEKCPGINVQTNADPPTCHRGRKPVADNERLSDRLWLRIDRPRRERTLRLAHHLNVSEAEVTRRAIDALWEREMGPGETPPGNG